MIAPGHMAPYAQLSDGCLDIMIARNLGSVDLGILLTGLKPPPFFLRTISSLRTRSYDIATPSSCPSCSSVAPLEVDQAS